MTGVVSRQGVRLPRVLVDCFFSYHVKCYQLSGAIGKLVYLTCNSILIIHSEIGHLNIILITPNQLLSAATL